MSTNTRNLLKPHKPSFEVRRQIDAWLDAYDGELTHFVTLTFDPKKIDAYISKYNLVHDRYDPKLVDLYQRSMRHFLNRLQKRLYGNLAKKKRSRLLFIPIIEGLKRGETPHYHCFMRVCSDRSDNIKQALRECWGSVAFSGVQKNLQNYRDHGCLRYGAKDAISLNRESVDWLNIQMPYRSNSLAE